MYKHVYIYIYIYAHTQWLAQECTTNHRWCHVPNLISSGQSCACACVLTHIPLQVAAIMRMKNALERENVFTARDKWVNSYANSEQNRQLMPHRLETPLKHTDVWSCMYEICFANCCFSRYHTGEGVSKCTCVPLVWKWSFSSVSGRMSHRGCDDDSQHLFVGFVRNV
jgi:hypothetical protein